MTASWLDDGDVQLYHGDALEVLRSLPAGSVQTCVSSPPYFALRDYGVRGQIGLEATVDEYVAALVAVFAEVWRVLRDDATLWLNLGDSYAGGGGFYPDSPSNTPEGLAARGVAAGGGAFTPGPARARDKGEANHRTPRGLKPKDLVGIPWSVAQALQAPRYMGRIQAERDRVWLAATIDAEGTICGFHHERADDGSTRTGIHLTITNTCMALLDEAHRIWPVSRSDHNPHGNGHLGNREVRRWIAHNVDDKSLLLQELYPHLIAKRTQALLAWNFLEMSKVSKRIGKLAEGREAKERRSWIVHALSALNRGDGVDVPAWVKEPPTLFSDGWYLRSDIIWAKPNPMPESVTDRPTKAHEYVFLLAKQPRYFFDADAIREAHSGYERARTDEYAAYAPPGQNGHGGLHRSHETGRNARSVWEIATQPTAECHFATFPEALVRRCILAGSSERGGCAKCGAPWQRQTDTEYVKSPVHGAGSIQGSRGAARDDTHMTGGRANKAGIGDQPRVNKQVTTTGWAASCACGAPPVPQTVLDPFVGSGTTALVARKHGRRAIGIDLSEAYLAIAARRLGQQSLFAQAGGVA